MLTYRYKFDYMRTIAYLDEVGYCWMICHVITMMIIIIILDDNEFQDARRSSLKPHNLIRYIV